MSEFVWAIQNGDLDMVKDLVNRGSQVNQEIDGRYPIHFAADYGQKEVMEFLIKKGAQVDVQDKHGIAPILAAIWEGHKECVKLLLANGAKKEGNAPDGSSYLKNAESDDLKALLQ